MELTQENIVRKLRTGIIYDILKDLPSSRIKSYEEFANSKELTSIFDDEESISTILAFFENNLNISETSKKIFMHRNTLIYRLDKIQKLTGLDIRKFDDAMTMNILLVIKFKENKNK